MRSTTLHCDVVVIGAGTAGMATATRLAQAGARVAVVARGHGSTHLAPATIDVAGYLPDTDGDGSRTAHEGAPHGHQAASGARTGFDAIVAAHPEHPYAKVGFDTVREGVEWWQRTVAAGPFPGYEYVGSLETNMLLPTAVGALRPSALVPQTMAAGDAGNLTRVAVVGTPLLRDFHPTLCAGNLRAAGIDARPVLVDLELERADASCLTLAHHLDRAAWRAGFCEKLRPLLGDAEVVALPAILGVQDPFTVWRDVEDRLGRRVCEIPTLPPSVPGMRLYEILRSALRAAGGRLAMGAEIHAHDRDGARVRSVRAHAAGRDLEYAADWFVLASGGFSSGAIELDADWQTHERVLDLPLSGVPGPGEPRFVPEYDSQQPMARAGVACDENLIAEGTENVAVVGAALAGAAPWREGSGEGIALASAVTAAQVIDGSLSEQSQHTEVAR